MKGTYREIGRGSGALLIVLPFFFLAAGTAGFVVFVSAAYLIPLFVVGLFLTFWLSELGERRWWVWVFSFILAGFLYLCALTYFNAPVISAQDTISARFLLFPSCFAAVPALLMWQYSIRAAEARGEGEGSPQALIRRNAALFRGRFFLNLISAYGLSVILVVPFLLALFDANFSDISLTQFFQVFSDHLYNMRKLITFSVFGIIPLFLAYLRSMVLFRVRQKSFGAWVGSYSAIGVLYGIVASLWMVRPGHFSPWFQVALIGFFLMLATGLFVWPFVSKLMKALPDAAADKNGESNRH